jgi:histidyl-tRNA synthetase
MSKLITSIQGTEDVLPGSWGHWRLLSETARRTFERYGYGELRIPLIEDTRLFVKGTGETTDIVQKEMYTIPSKDEDSVTLRPEGTPGAIRAYLEHSLDKQAPFQKLYYVGAMFRHERPQRGRLRQFHQLGIEAIGGASPLLDVETILVALDIFRGVGLKQPKLWINTIGCQDCRPAFREMLRGILNQHLNQLCDDCRARIDRNVLRVYDCKNEGCRRVVETLPTMVEHLDAACAEHYAEVKTSLDRAGVPFAEDRRLVRGLDYYTRTVYEIKHPSLGARDTICGGGRYDGLVELLGGPPTPCVGFGLGCEATLLAMEAELGTPEDSSPRPNVYIICFEKDARTDCFVLVEELRRAGLSADMDYEGRSAKAQMRMANRLKARYCFLVGSDELAARTVTVKDMSDGSQRSVARAEVVEEMRGLMGRGTPKS